MNLSDSFEQHIATSANHISQSTVVIHIANQKNFDLRIAASACSRSFFEKENPGISFNPKLQQTSRLSQGKGRAVTCSQSCDQLISGGIQGQGWVWG